MLYELLEKSKLIPKIGRFQALPNLKVYLPLADNVICMFALLRRFDNSAMKVVKVALSSISFGQLN